jgi:hypothetical protein
MLAAIDRCRAGNGIMRTVPRWAGLRCIREFERINGVEFDPFSAAHLMTVGGMGPFSATFFAVRVRFERLAPTT